MVSRVHASDRAVAPGRRVSAAALRAQHEAFMSAVANERRTPLTAVHGALALLARRLPSGGGGSAERDMLLAIAQRNTERLIRLVDDALDVAQPGPVTAPSPDRGTGPASGRPSPGRRRQ